MLTGNICFVTVLSETTTHTSGSTAGTTSLTTTAPSVSSAVTMTSSKDFNKRSYAYYKIMATDSEPNTAPLASDLMTSSINTCSVRCLRGIEACVVFTVQAQTSGQYLCTLYKAVVVQELMPKSGLDTYGMLPY